MMTDRRTDTNTHRHIDTIFLLLYRVQGLFYDFEVILSDLTEIQGSLIKIVLKTSFEKFDSIKA
jgi:hypothetical protein